MENGAVNYVVIRLSEFTICDHLERDLNKLLPNLKEITSISGVAKETDTLAEKYAVARDYRFSGGLLYQHFSA